MPTTCSVRWSEANSPYAPYQGGINPFVHSREHYEVARKIFYDRVTRRAFQDPQPHAAVAALRTALELKLREAVVVVGFRVEASSGVRAALSRLRSRLCGGPALTRSQFVRVDVSDIIRAARDLQLESPIAFAHLQRVYEWSNRIMHAGVRRPRAEIWFALEVLLPAMRGTKTREWSYTANPIVSTLDRGAQADVLRTHLRLGERGTPVFRES